MPLSKEHADIFPTDLAIAFKEKVAITCSTAEVCLLDLTNDHRFFADDYLDLVPLNKKDSLKFWDVLIVELKKQSCFHQVSPTISTTEYVLI